MEIKIKCLKCGTVNDFGSAKQDVQLHHEVEADFNGKAIKITYFDCVECGHRHIVQMDDVETMQLFERCMVVLRKKMKLRRKGKDLGTNEAKRFANMRKQLNDERHKLLAKYNGAPFVLDGQECIADVATVGGDIDESGW